MKIKTLVDLVKAGKKPMVRITGYVLDDMWGEVGMLAEVTAIWDEPECLGATFDYSKFREHNTALMGHDWFLSDAKKAQLGREKGTAIESGHIKEDLIEDIYLELDGEVNLELAEDNPVLNEYLSMDRQETYVEWLEKFIQANVPDCMKPWTKF